LSARELTRIATRFKVLGEPARLAVLQRLQAGPQHVSALVAVTGLRQANLSKHLQTLREYGVVFRVRHGRFIHYRIADPVVVALCDLMCRHLELGPHRTDVGRRGTGRPYRASQTGRPQ